MPDHPRPGAAPTSGVRASEPPAPLLRDGRDADAPGLIALIAACWAEYPGCVMDLDGEVPELRALATHYRGKRGRLWVAEAGGAVVGVVAAAPAGEAGWEVGRMYVAAPWRGTGLATRLLAAAEAHAAAAGAGRLLLWSDTRFERAHAFYACAGFLRAGPIRALGDRSNTLEFGFAKPLGRAAALSLDAAGALSAERPLAALLAASSTSWPDPLPDPRRHWRDVAGEVALGRRALLAGWSEGRLVGTAQMLFDQAPPCRHRAALHALLVAPEARRRGVGRALLDAATAAAHAAGRSLLTLEAPEGPPAALVLAAGWRAAGCLPGGVLGADGTTHDALLFGLDLEAPDRSTP